MTKAASYAAAHAESQRLLREGRLADRDEHFPYKHAAVSALIAENPPAGPDGPEDDRLRIEDFLSQAIADASKTYIAAQQGFLRHPGDGTRAEYEAAKAALVAARQAHRVHRGSGINVVGIRARRAGE
jgi:hypothetical protein